MNVRGLAIQIQKLSRGKHWQEQTLKCVGKATLEKSKQGNRKSQEKEQQEVK